MKEGAFGIGELIETSGVYYGIMFECLHGRMEFVMRSRTNFLRACVFGHDCFTRKAIQFRPDQIRSDQITLGVSKVSKTDGCGHSRILLTLHMMEGVIALVPSFVGLLFWFAESR